MERRLDSFRQSVEHTNEKLTELTGVYDDVQVMKTPDTMKDYYTILLRAHIEMIANIFIFMYSTG